MKHYLKRKTEFVLGCGYVDQVPIAVCEVEYQRYVEQGVPRNVWFEEISTDVFEAIKNYLIPNLAKIAKQEGE